MNPERMHKVADAIEQAGRFKYDAWACADAILDEDGEPALGVSTTRELIGAGTLRHCGTTGCIAGWAATLAIEEGLAPINNVMISSLAQDYLELTSGEAHDLFLGGAMKTAGFYPSSGEALDNATAVEAAKVLRMVADGEVEL